MNFISCHAAPCHLGGMWLKSSLGGFAVPLGALCIFPLGFGWTASSLDLEWSIWYLIDTFSSIMMRSPEKFSQVACWSSCPYLSCGWGCTESPSCWTLAVLAMPWRCQFRCFQQDFTAFIIFIVLFSLPSKPSARRTLIAPCSCQPPNLTRSS